MMTSSDEVRYTDVCRWTAKHQRNIYVAAWQSTGGISEQLINVSSLGLMLKQLNSWAIQFAIDGQFGCVARTHSVFVLLILILISFSTYVKSLMKSKTPLFTPQKRQMPKTGRYVNPVRWGPMAIRWAYVWSDNGLTEPDNKHTCSLGPYPSPFSRGGISKKVAKLEPYKPNQNETKTGAI